MVASSDTSSRKPAVLIIGGLGYIGRFLALHIHQNDLASEIRLVDKVLPQLARLPPEFEEVCCSANYLQADASRIASLERVFKPANAAAYDFVFNCGGETRYSQDPSVYQVRNLRLSVSLAEYCVGLNPGPVLVEFGTGVIYKSPSSGIIAAGGCKEDAAIKPWLEIARCKWTAEEALEKLSREKGLKCGTLRLGHVYGPYDVGFLSRALCLARVYQDLDQEMKWLWGKDLRINMVHVEDVCRAAWALATWIGNKDKRNGHDEKGTTNSSSTLHDRAFNIVDDGDTKQADLATLFGDYFDIETGFQGALISQFAKLNLESVIDDVNDEILQPWAMLVKNGGLDQGQGTPLSPFVETELITDSHLCLSNAKAKRVLDWEIARPRLDGKAIEEIIESYRRMRWWP